MIDRTTYDAILWQLAAEDMVPEPPIAVKRYADIICLTQEDRSININPESVRGLVKLLREAVAPPKEKP